MSFLGNWTLQKRISLFVGLGLALGVALFIWVGTQALNESRDRTLRERLTIARLAASHIQETIGRSLIDVEHAATLLEKEQDTTNFRAAVTELERTLNESGFATHSFFLTDSTGQIVQGYPEQPGIVGFEMSVYPDLVRALITGQPTVSGLVSAPVTQAPVVMLIGPIIQEPATIAGALVANIDIGESHLRGFIQPIRLGLTGYAEIVDGSGTVVVRTEPGLPPATFEKSDHPERFAALIQQRKATVGTCHRCHTSGQETKRRRDVLAFAPLSTIYGEEGVAPWGVAIRQSEEEAMAPTRQLQGRLLILGAAIVALGILMVWITTRNIVRPIKMLTTGAEKIAQGDLTSSVTIQAKDEIGTLARTFDTMRQKLKSSAEEIEGWNRELEDRVQQRTKESFCLLEVAKAVASTLDVDALHNVIMSRVIEILEPTDAGCLLLYDARQDRLITSSASGMRSGFLAELWVRPGQSLPGRVFQSGKPVLCPTPEEVAEEMREVEVINPTHREETVTALSQARSAICAPLISKNRFIGALLLMNFHNPGSFSESDINLVQAVADQVATATENARLLKEADDAKTLRETDRVRSQLISMVSHELRTPLTSIKGYSTSLLREDVDWDEKTKREFLQVIDQRADDLRDLIDKLLQMSRVEAGALALEKEPLLMGRLARKVVEQATRRDRKHTFTVDFPSPFPVVEADVRYVEQVLQNLVENAVKYSPQGSQITITGRVEGENIAISVQDEGVGIPPEHLDRIFQRFYRVNGEASRTTSGSGLGLSIAKGVVEAHGGSIWVESTPGKGSTFYFTLPKSADIESEDLEAYGRTD
jgi:signal transduction histidine kinase/HAMP domain-containing protein